MPELASDAYRRIQIGTASPLQLVVMMYDGVVRFLTLAARDLEAGKTGEAGNWMDRAAAIIQELLGTLDFAAGGAIAAQLGQVYTMTLRETLTARLRHDPEILRKLAALYLDLKGAWSHMGPAKAV